MNIQPVPSFLRLVNARSTHVKFFIDIYNRLQWRHGTWNDVYAHKISAPNTIKIIGYQAFNLEKSRLLIGFLYPYHRPQFLCCIIHSHIINLCGQSQKSNLSLYSLLSFLSLILTINDRQKGETKREVGDKKSRASLKIEGRGRRREMRDNMQPIRVIIWLLKNT